MNKTKSLSIECFYNSINFWLLLFLFYFLIILFILCIINYSIYIKKK